MIGEKEKVNNALPPTYEQTVSIDIQLQEHHHQSTIPYSQPVNYGQPIPYAQPASAGQPTQYIQPGTYGHPGPQPVYGAAASGPVIQLQQPIIYGQRPRTLNEQRAMRLFMTSLNQHLGKQPVMMICPNCQSQITTEVELVIGNCQWIVAIFLCAFL